MGKFIRIWKNVVTGELSERKVDDNYTTTNMAFDSETKMIFYKFSEVATVISKNFENQVPHDTKVGFMCPYINERGKHCCFFQNIICQVD